MEQVHVARRECGGKYNLSSFRGSISEMISSFFLLDSALKSINSDKRTQSCVNSSRAEIEKGQKSETRVPCYSPSHGNFDMPRSRCLVKFFIQSKSGTFAFRGWQSEEKKFSCDSNSSNRNAVD